jgi:hypothetical protein
MPDAPSCRDAPSPLLAPLAALALSALPAGAAAEPLHLFPESARGLAALEDGAARLVKARAAMDALLAHEAPPGAPADWDGAPAALLSAANLLHGADGPALPEPGAYAMGNDQLRACATRAAALAQADRLQRGALADAQRCAETRAVLRDRLAAVQRADEARRALLKGSALVAGDAAAAEWFTWRWADLDRPLGNALAQAGADVRRWADRVERVQGELKARAAALAGLQADFGRARDCALAGRWAGTRTREGAVSGLALTLAPAGASWTGTLDVDGAALPVKGVTLKGNTVSMSVGEGQATLRGTLSGDEQVLKGTYSSIDGPTPFTLRRQ